MKALAELSKLASKANKGQAKQAKIDSIVIGGQNEKFGIRKDIECVELD